MKADRTGIMAKAPELGRDKSHRHAGALLLQTYFLRLTSLLTMSPVNGST